MKLQQSEKNIVCPKCGEDEFIDVEFRETRYSTYQIWCADKECKTDILVPSKLVAKKLIVKL